MARPGGPLLEFNDDWTPIFLDRGRSYDHLSALALYRPAAGGAEVEARTAAGEAVRVRISFVTPEIVRLRAWLWEEPPADSPMLVEGAQRLHEPRLEEDDSGLTLDSGALRLKLGRSPWSVTIRDGDRRALWEQRPDDRQIRGPLVLPAGYSRPDGRAPEAGGGTAIAFHESFSLEPDERLYGLGEQFGPFDKRGQRIVSWSRDPLGAITTTMSYLNIPFLLSSRGYGLFLHHHSKIVYELGQPTPQSAAFRVDDPYLDYFFIYGPTPKEVIGRYGELTGRPAVPPLWSFGAWYSRCMYRDRQQVEQIVERLRELAIPGDVVHLDPLWLEGRSARRRDGCHFVWDEEAFPEPEGFVRWLGERGFKLSLWENPYVYRGTPMYEEGEREGHFARGSDGPARPLDNPEETALVDFTKPEAARWWQEKHRPYLRMGVASFKSDYGEAVPPDAHFADGRDGNRLHNLYPLLYNRAVFEVIREERGEAIVFGRSGYAGSQRYPINWTGDAPCTWGGLAATLRAGLSLSLSGISMWSHDIGGFWNPPFVTAQPDPTLYVRWAQFGLLSSHARFHGVGPREPWEYGEKAVEVVREFARLRYRLLPYIYSLAKDAAETGLPVVRPLLLEYLDDAVAATADFEYLLGPELLVVPVTNAEGRALVYLPDGEWFDWWTGEAHRGPKQMRREVPLERLPLYVKQDSVLPLAPEMQYVGEKPWQPLTLEVRLAGAAAAKLWSPEQPVSVRASREGGDIEVEVDGPEQEYELRLVEPRSLAEARVEGATLESLERTSAGAVALVSGGGRWKLRGRV